MRSAEEQRIKSCITIRTLRGGSRLNERSSVRAGVARRDGKGRGQKGRAEQSKAKHSKAMRRQSINKSASVCASSGRRYGIYIHLGRYGITPNPRMIWDRMDV